MDGLTSFQNSRLCYGPIHGLRQREDPDKMEFAVGKQSQAGSSRALYTEFGNHKIENPSKNLPHH